MALRARREPSRLVATLKSGGTVEGAVHSRDEVEAEADEAAIARGEWPGAIGERIAETAAGRPLVPLVQVENRRRTWSVHRDWHRVAEVALDQGVIRAAGREQPFQEIEVEIKDNGTMDDLEAVTNWLTGRLPLAPEPDSKFARGQRLLDEASEGHGESATAGGPGPESLSIPVGRQPLLAVAAGIVRKNLQRLHEAEPVAREGSDPEGVHDLRVATRRIRAALQVVEDSLPSARSTRRLRRRLRSLANNVAAVRDADVMLEALDLYAQELSPEEAAGLGALRAAIEKHRRRGRRAMLQSLDSRRTARLLRRLERWAVRAETAGVRPSGEPRPVLVRHLAGAATWRRYGEVLAFETAMPDPPTPTLHLLRIAGKRLRYTLEFFQDGLGPGAGSLLKRLVALQDRLGAVQDAAVAVGMVEDLAARRQGTAALQAFRDRRLQEQARLIAEFDGDWQPIAGEDFRRKLGELLAAL